MIVQSRCLALVLALLLAGVPLAATAAAPRISGAEVIVMPDAALAHAVRIVAPDGQQSSRLLAAGETLVLSAPTAGWRDGRYAYELLPVAGNRIRSQDDEAVPGAILPAQRGSFLARGGQLLSVQADSITQTRGTPVGDIHIQTPNSPRLRLEQTAAGGFAAQTWDVMGNEANFVVRDVSSGNRLPLRVRPGAPTSSLDIAASGNVGLGTAAPNARLHIAGSSGNAMALVTETATPALGRDLFRLENFGPTRMRLRNTNTGNEWSLNAHDADFRITLAGSPVVSMLLYPNGNVTIAGTLTQSSDRNAKENIRPLHPQTVLDKLDQLTISEWNFKSDGESIRHAGPMAQDFRALFGFGDRDDRIALIDVAGIALAGVKALRAEVAARDRSIAALEARLAALDARLARQEARELPHYLPAAAVIAPDPGAKGSW